MGCVVSQTKFHVLAVTPSVCVCVCVYINITCNKPKAIANGKWQCDHINSNQQLDI